MNVPSREKERLLLCHNEFFPNIESDSCISVANKGVCSRQMQNPNTLRSLLNLMGLILVNGESIIFSCKIKQHFYFTEVFLV